MVDGGTKSGCWRKMSRRGGGGEVGRSGDERKPERERAQVSE